MHRPIVIPFLLLLFTTVNSAIAEIVTITIWSEEDNDTRVIVNEDNIFAERNANEGDSTTEYKIGSLDDDGDGLLNFEEEELGTDKARADSDGDGLRDGMEVVAGLDPLNAHTFSEQQTDAEFDLDDDGYSNIEEQRAMTSLTDPTDYPGTANPQHKFGDGSCSWRVFRP